MLLFSMVLDKEDFKMTTAKYLSEQKVLKKLGIEDFRHLTKAKVIHLASMLNQMDPEVAKKALEQFPEFSKTLSEMAHEYRDTLERAVSSNNESVQTYYGICKSIIDSLQKELENENLSFEERKYIIEQMKDIAQMVGEKDSENKKFLASMVAIGAVVLTAAAAFLAQALGGNTNLQAAEEENEESFDEGKNCSM